MGAKQSRPCVTCCCRPCACASCGPCVTCPVRYDVRKRQEKVDPLTQPLPSVRTPIEKFDTIKSRRSSSGVDTFRSSRVSPREEDDANSHDVPPLKDVKTDDSGSDLADSDLGSECLSLAYTSSGRSEGNDPGGLRAPEVGRTHADNDLQLKTLSSVDSDEMLDTLDVTHTFGTIAERRYTISRLSQRQTSNSSNKSADIIQWKKGNRLGRGTYGTVFLGLTVTGELIAIKQIELIETEPKEADKEYAKIYEEVSLLKELKHNNIVGYLGSSYEKLQNHVISVFMQYVPGGSLASVIQKFGPLEEPITARYSRQLLDAVSYLHRINVIHRDIKSANILLMPEGVIKLIDFGCAKRLAMRLSQSGSHLQQSLKGTPYWMAPEVINETGHGKKSDIWSVGCTVFEMLTGKPPWGDREPLAAIYAIGSDEFPVPLLPEDYSETAREFVQLAMIRDKHKRPPASRLLKHPFVQRPSSKTSNTSARWGHRRTDPS